MKRILILLFSLFSLACFSQDGLLFHDGNVLTNNGNVLNYFPVSRTDLQAKFDITYTNSSGDLLNMAGGANAVYVSGSDTGAIYDFSGLNDVRFNKNAYVGNSFALPEYYDFPYSSEIYFDTNNPYHWKLKDFHYANIQAQMVNLNNCFFLKAKATTNTSNEIASVQELLIYSTDYTETTCYSSGTMYKESLQAYGLVFDGIVNKGKDTGYYRINFISDNTNNYPNFQGYNLAIGADEAIYLIRVNEASGTTILRSAISYLQLYKNYRLLIFRNETENQFVTGAVGMFAVYIQGKNKAITTTKYTVPNLDEMELVDVTGGAGSNPVIDNTHTTSNYIVGDLDSGDKIQIDSEDFSTWTQGTGKYAHYNNGEQTGVNLAKLKNYIGIQKDFYGDELIINGGFNTDTDWIKQSGWTISGGYANGTATTSVIYQTNVVEIGNSYRCEYTITNYTDGSVRIFCGGSTIGTTNSAIGTYIQTLIASGNSFIYFDGAAAFNGSIDNVSIRQFYQNYYK